MNGIRELPLRAEIDGVPVVLDPDSPDIAHAAGFWPLKRIVVNPAWFELDAEVQGAVLRHELHHCKAFHMEIRLLMLPICWTKFAQRVGQAQELAADAYAAKMGYRNELIRFIARHQTCAEPFHVAPMTRIASLIKGTSS